MDCDHCGYRPRTRDCFTIKMNESEADEYSVVHVICYNCGQEWVE